MLKLELDGDGSHCGLTDLYDDFREDLFTVLRSQKDFSANWGSKKESVSGKIERKDSEVTVSVYLSMDDLPDLIQGVLEDLGEGRDLLHFLEEHCECQTEVEDRATVVIADNSSAEEQWESISTKLTELYDSLDEALEENYAFLKELIKECIQDRDAGY